MDALEFYIGELEEAIAAHDREVQVRPAGTFGSNANALAQRVVEAGRALITAWDAENQPFEVPDPFKTEED